MDAPAENTRTLILAVEGDADAAARLAPLVYDELHGLARAWLRRGGRAAAGGDPVLQTTAMLHDAFARLMQADEVEWRSRAHFFAVGARAMRQILVSQIRAARAAKRGAGLARVPISHAEAEAAQFVIGVVDAVALDDALTRLGELDQRQARIVEMRIFGGMTHPEIASVLDVSEPTVKREWRAARAWLSVELREG